MKRLVLLLVVSCLILPAASFAKPMPALDKQIDEATMAFKTEIKEGAQILSSAKGYLIFPEVTKAGIGIGGEYGKGALVVDGEIKEYFSTTAASLGAQLGVKTKSVVITFKTDEALEKFEKSKGWEVGVDAAVAVAEIGTQGSVNTTTTMKKPIVAYVYGESGLMADVSLSGSKISRLQG